jgi:glyoxylase-like metal-dependent hydrolase (beta-lactamase superfamily II)
MMKTRSLSSSLAFLGFLAFLTLLTLPGARAHAEAKLGVQVLTASPQGFLVDSTLVTGEKDAVLIDGQFTLADAHRVVAAILDSRKTLTTVYVTHAHPDHYFGLVAIHQAFPGAKIVALPATIADIDRTWKQKLAQWGPMYGANLSTHPLVPTPLTGRTISLEGKALEIRGGVQGDAANSSYVWIPSIKTVVAGDIVYQGVHPWTAETDAQGRRVWRKTLDELAALHPAMVVAGHKDPKAADDTSGIDLTRAYLEAFDEAVASSRSADEAEQKIKARYPHLALDVIAHFGAAAQFATTAKK